MNTFLRASVIAAACCLASCQIGMADVGTWYERSVEWLVDSSDAIALAEAVAPPVAFRREYRIGQLLKAHKGLQPGQLVQGPLRHGGGGQKVLLFFRETPEGVNVFHLIALDSSRMIQFDQPLIGQEGAAPDKPKKKYLAVDKRGRVISTEEELIRRVRDRLRRGSSVLPTWDCEAAEKNQDLWWNAGDLIDEYGTWDVFMVFIPPDVEFGEEFARQFRRYIKREESERIREELGKPEVHELVGRTLALYCQSDRVSGLGEVDTAWFPPELIRLGRGKIVFNHGQLLSAVPEFEGHGYGYSVRYNDYLSKKTGTNVWRLSRTFGPTSYPRSQVLHDISLPPEESLSAEQIKTIVLRGHDTIVQQYPRDPFAHRKRIQAYLKHEEVGKARDACRVALKALPDDAWIVLVNALLTAIEKSPEKGASQMQAWVERDADFFRWLDLAYYWQLLDRPEKAAEAMEKAAEFDARALWGHGGKTEAQGYSAARYAYESGQYEAAIKLCDTILETWSPSSFQIGAVRKLRSAARDAQQSKRSQLQWPDDPLPYNEFQNFDVERLLGRAVRESVKEP